MFAYVILSDALVFEFLGYLPYSKTHNQYFGRGCGSGWGQIQDFRNGGLTFQIEFVFLIGFRLFEV